MIKREPGYDPKFGDWEYFQSTPDGKLISRGNSQNEQIASTCVSCHSNITDQDFVFATHFSISAH